MTFRKNYFVEDLSKAASQKISFQPAKDLKINFSAGQKPMHLSKSRNFQLIPKAYLATIRASTIELFLSKLLTVLVNYFCRKTPL